MQVLLQRAFIETRNLALRKAQQQILDLADTFEVIPPLLLHWEEKHGEYLRGLLARYQQKYEGIAYDYLSILEMKDSEFEEVFESREAF